MSARFHRRLARPLLAVLAMSAALVARATPAAGQVAPTQPRGGATSGASAVESTQDNDVPDSDAQEDDAQALVAVVEQRMAAEMEAQSIPGAVVAVITDGEATLLRGYGVSDVDSQHPVDARQTVFHVASLSKHVTAIAVLQLVEEGRLDLHADVNDYLSAFSVEAPAPVTLHHLLTHTSGLDRGLIARKGRAPDDIEPLGDFLARQLPRVVRRPGEVSVYSNYGFALAGHVVEAVSGMPFARYAAENIFAPLRMSSTSFAVEPEIEARMATGYSWRGGGGPSLPRDYIKTVPASMMRTTAADMSRLMGALLGGGILEDERILTKRSTELVLSRQFANHPLLNGRSYGLAEGGRFAQPTFLHTGGASGFSSAIVLHPQLRFGIFVAFNSQAFAWDLINAVLDRFDERLAAPSIPEPLEPPPATERFAGWYRSAEMPLTGIARLASLVEQTRVDAAGPGAIEWDGRRFVAVDPLAFRAVDGRALLAFGERDDEVRYFFRSGGEYERVGAFESQPAQLALWIAFTLALVLIPAAAAVDAWRSRGRAAPTELRAARAGLRLAGLAALIHLAFLAGLGASMAAEMGGDGVMEYGMPLTVRLLLLLPWLAIGVSAAAAVAVARGRAAQPSGAAGALWATVAVATLAALVPFLYSWNLLASPF